MRKKIKDLKLDENLTKKKLLKTLKNELDDVYIFDIMKSYVQLVEDGKYVQIDYQKEFLDAYIRGFLIRVKEIKDDKKEYEGLIDKTKFLEAFNILDEQKKMVDKERSLDSNFFRIYESISLYTTFILEEPIHIVGTLFPGGFRVNIKEKNYYCPVKDKQKDNPGAVCGFCIAKQDEEV